MYATRANCGITVAVRSKCGSEEEAEVSVMAPRRAGSDEVTSTSLGKGDTASLLGQRARAHDARYKTGIRKAWHCSVDLRCWRGDTDSRGGRGKCLGHLCQLPPCHNGHIRQAARGTWNTAPRR